MSKSVSREKHTEYVQTTFTPSQRRDIESAALAEGRTLSAWIRRACLAALPSTQGVGKA